jgi:hypothetical protein
MVSALDYMERVLGYAPHAAMERLRVARALESLPALEESLGDGSLNFSAIRELTRVAPPQTEQEWRDQAVLGKNVRQIEELVAGHAPGDRPDDPANPEMRRHPVKLELSPEVYARWRQTETALAEEHGGRLDDDALATVMCDAALDRGSEPTGRAKFQILITQCRTCSKRSTVTTLSRAAHGHSSTSVEPRKRSGSSRSSVRTASSRSAANLGVDRRPTWDWRVGRMSARV